MGWLLTLLDHESFFHAIMATIPSSILILDERLAVLTVNHNFLEKSRNSLNSILGRRLHEIFPAAFQDTALDRQIREVILTGRTLHRQRMTYRAPGVSLRVYSYSICPLQLLGGSRGAILVMDDVTDLLQLGEEVRRMQLHLASIVESAGDLIISTDPNGAIMTWNTRGGESDWLHASRSARLQARRPHRRAAKSSRWKLAFAASREIDDRRSVEWPMRCQDGESIPVSWRLSRMTGNTGEVTGVVVVGRNLVEQRAMEAQMRQGEKLAALGMVIGGIAHEIRNPLGVSSAAAQLMQRQDRLAGLARRVHRQSHRAVSTGLRSSSKACCVSPDPGRSRRRRRSMCSTCSRTPSMFASGEAAAGTTVEWRLPSPASPVYAEGVQNLLELVVINLYPERLPGHAQRRPTDDRRLARRRRKSSSRSATPVQGYRKLMSPRYSIRSSRPATTADDRVSACRCPIPSCVNMAAA